MAGEWGKVRMLALLLGLLALNLLPGNVEPALRSSSMLRSSSNDLDLEATRVNVEREVPAAQDPRRSSSTGLEYSTRGFQEPDNDPPLEINECKSCPAKEYQEWKHSTEALDFQSMDALVNAETSRTRINEGIEELPGTPFQSVEDITKKTSASLKETEELLPDANKALDDRIQGTYKWRRSNFLHRNISIDDFEILDLIAIVSSPWPADPFAADFWRLEQSEEFPPAIRLEVSDFVELRKYETQGGYGDKVFLARYDGKLYAIKTLVKQPDLVVYTSGLREVYFNTMLREEASQCKPQVLSEVFFPTCDSDLEFLHIARFEGFAEDEKNITLFFWHEGETLNRVLRNPELSIRERKGFMRQFLRGVSFLHAREIYHRDIKPQNLVVDEYGTLRLIDLGTAVDLESFRSMYSPTNGARNWQSTPGYAPPERNFDPNKLFDLSKGAKFDMFMVGVVGLEIFGAPNMLTLPSHSRSLAKSILQAYAYHLPQLYLNNLMEFSAWMQVYAELCMVPTDGFIFEHSIKLEFLDSLDLPLVSPGCKEKLPSKTGLSQEEIEFLSTMLKWDPDDRVTAEEALRHPFLRI